MVEIKRLKKELSDFFSKNEVLGIHIKDFTIDIQKGNYFIGVIMPNLERGKFFETNQDYSEEINQIGRKYNLSQLGFALSCYGK